MKKKLLIIILSFLIFSFKINPTADAQGTDCGAILTQCGGAVGSTTAFDDSTCVCYYFGMPCGFGNGTCDSVTTYNYIHNENYSDCTVYNNPSGGNTQVGCFLQDCNSGTSCGTCNAPANTCSADNGTQSCTYTTYTDPTNHNTTSDCTQVSAPTQSCSVGCSPSDLCLGGECVTPTLPPPPPPTVTGPCPNPTPVSNCNDITCIEQENICTASDTCNACTGQCSATNYPDGTVCQDSIDGSGNLYATEWCCSGICGTYNCGVATPTPTSSPSCELSATEQQCNSSGTGWVTISSDVCVSPSACSVSGLSCNGSGGGGSGGGGTSPTCTNPTYADCGPCQAPANTCSTGNATSLCYYGTPTGCAGSANVSCGTTINNCTSPDVCVDQECVPPATLTPVPTPIPTYTISGNVFIDTNKNGIMDGGETNYTGTITVESSGIITYPTNGAFEITGLSPETDYTVTYTSLPAGDKMTTGSSYDVSVGPGTCSVGGNTNASCDDNGNIVNLDFGITNSSPWIQSSGTDIREDAGFNNPIPANAECGSYASIPSSSNPNPGIIFSGDESYDFGNGQASTDNWIVGGTAYPEVYTPSQEDVIKTSYNYLLAVAQDNGLTATAYDLSKTDPATGNPFCGGGLTNCTLESGLPHGLYLVNGNLTLNGYTFPANSNYVFLINGNLTINGKIHLPVTSVAFFTSSGNIYVDKSVGESDYTSTATDLEGTYSADYNFVVEGNDPTGQSQNCAAGNPDLRLNVAGSAITHASLGSNIAPLGPDGSYFLNERDLCGGDAQCPVFSISSRPDFLINSSNLIKSITQIWKEVAP